MAVKSEKLYELRKQVKKLGSFRGSGTQLISVYIPSGSPVHEMTGKLRKEMSQASNIKSKQTMTNVQGALERIINHLKIFKKTPKNGIAVFAGNISDNVAKIDIQLFSIEPPEPLKIGTYRCDSSFFLEPLEQMMESKDKYGVVVLDGREATLATVHGTQVHVIKKLNSTAHAKVRKGGQCLSADTLIMKDSGEIVDIQNFKSGVKTIGVDFKTSKTCPAIASDFFVTPAKNSVLIKTKNPLGEIHATLYHRFFVISEYGIKEKFAKDLDKNDKILIARKINAKSVNNIKTGYVPKRTGSKSVKFPEYWNENLARLFGIICGDGTEDGNRIIIYEGSRELKDRYAKLVERAIGIKPTIRVVDKRGQPGSFAKNKYFEIRIYSAEFVDAIKQIAPEIVSKQRDIPNNMLKCNDRIVAAFLSGLYDAEGYLNKTTVDIAMTDKKLIKKIQLILLRFGILSSFQRKTAKGTPQWSVRITDLNSVKSFRKNIDFQRKDKKKKLKKTCNRSQAQQYVDQIPIDGREIYKLAKEIGLKTSDFYGASNFFRNKKPLDREAFYKRIISVFKKQNNKKAREILRYLMSIYQSDYTYTSIQKKTIIRDKQNFFDLTIPTYSNFIANGFVVHNSQRRYQRLVEEQIEKYYLRVSESMDDAFLNKVKGIIVGGPGPTKDFFLKAKMFNYQHKILGCVDTGYTDDYGIREVLAKSDKILAQQEAVKEKILVERFIKEVVSNGLATYGEKQVREAINTKQADKVLLSEGITHIIADYKCLGCEKQESRIFREDADERIKCDSCNGELKLQEEKSLLDDLADLARANNIEVEIISTNTTEGAQFSTGFGGIGAFLRYKKN